VLHPYLLLLVHLYLLKLLQNLLLQNLLHHQQLQFVE
jgi:hypothetical protein